MKTFSDAARFEVLSDGTVYARAGVQTNCGGIAGIHVRILLNPSGVVTFVAATVDKPHEDGYGGTVPGGAVPAPCRDLRSTPEPGKRSKNTGPVSV